MKQNATLLFLFLTTFLSASKNPNILFILADDLGYGDVACYSTDSKVATPNLDKLAKAGMRFLDAHSPSTVCTPSRYSLLTGQFAFRTGVYGVFTGVGGPNMIRENQLTLPQLLKEKDYQTALFGKWHIGMTFYDEGGRAINEKGLEPVKQIDYSRPASDAPIHRGFDDFFGTVCCPTTDWLYAFVDGDRIPVPPTKQLDQALKSEIGLPNHPYSKDCREGLIAPDFDMENVDLIFLDKSKSFLRNHSAKNPNRPFFLLHATQAVHLPSFAADQFKGKSGAGPHGDFIFQFDWMVGEILRTLEETGLVENTIIMIASDNGPELPTVKAMSMDHDHNGSHPWRGMKRDSWEGGHRVPFIVSWPGIIKPGSTSKQIVSLTDVMATVADLVGYELPNNSAEDSFSFLKVLTGEQPDSLAFKEYSLQQARRDNAKSIRKGKWKYLDHKGSGGNDYTRHGQWGAQYVDLPNNTVDAPAQLYNLDVDPGETNNLYYKHPEIVQHLREKLAELIENGRSRPKLSHEE
ncbi:MAG: sulfatase-like hydrolase/transferase [Saprospiraceae bacterium]|nr:sulfatase-like hydrolase/transferase [Saprospiraceae bacterium]